MAPPSTSTRDPQSLTAVPSTPDPDWPTQATDSIVKVVDSVRDKTTGPALNGARWLTYGLVIAILSIPLLVLLLIGVIRGLESFLLQVQSWTGWAWLHDPVWIVYAFLGTVFTLGGLFAWRKGKQTP